MGDIIPFLSRLVGRLDWSAAEKARLQQLADRMGQGELDLEVVFGRSDQGEPWCAVTGQDQEVLVHIARIGGRFIVHHLAEDILEAGESLWAAVERALGDAWTDLPAPTLAEVIPIEAQSRHTHILSALIVAAVLVEAEFAPPAEATAEEPADPLLPPADPPPEAVSEARADEPAAIPARAHDEPVKGSSAATRLAPLGQDEADSPAPPTPVAVQASAPAEPLAVEAWTPSEVHETQPREEEEEAAHRLVGSEGDDVMAGGAEAEVLFGAGGNDTLSGGGAPEGEFDWLHGGDGDDALIVEAQVVAVGGAGADRFTFVFDGGQGGQFGRVLDFTPSQGDVLQSAGAHPVALVSATAEADVLAGLPSPPQGFGQAGPPPGYRVGMDLDGDGQADGEVLLAGAEVSGFLAANLARPPAPPPPPGGAPVVEPAVEPPEDVGSFLL
ncbi:MAG: hypothetical protein WCY15_04150 [Phenylobacterium sp.]|uniref:calcium-binding protein n=1 Tax=Phenylobacterium sp. TaxID=1871053 RepID=UPI00355F050A